MIWDEEVDVLAAHKVVNCIMSTTYDFTNFSLHSPLQNKVVELARAYWAPQKLLQLKTTPQKSVEAGQKKGRDPQGNSLANFEVLVDISQVHLF